MPGRGLSSFFSPADVWLPGRQVRILHPLPSRSAEGGRHSQAGALPARSVLGGPSAAAIRSAGPVQGNLDDAEICVGGALTASSAISFCRTVRGYLEAGVRTLSLNLEAVEATDVVGLAALFQSVRLAALLGVSASVMPSDRVYHALLDAELLEEVPLVFRAGPEKPLAMISPASDRFGNGTPVLARTRRLRLRQPTWSELVLFQRWADEPLLDQMVGSELLYRCRHLGPDHPEFASAALGDATSLTLLIQPLAEPAPPVGFVRLYNVHLAEQFGFLETVVADIRSLRKGWGIEASRLLVAYAMDALGIRRVEAKVYAYNALSINSLKRNGCRLEGVLRRARSYNGQRWDILVFSILQEELEEQRKQEEFPYMGFWGDDPA